MRTFNHRNFIGGFIGGMLGILLLGWINIIVGLITSLVGFLSGFYYDRIWEHTGMAWQDAKDWFAPGSKEEVLKRRLHRSHVLCGLIFTALIIASSVLLGMFLWEDLDAINGSLGTLGAAVCVCYGFMTLGFTLLLAAYVEHPNTDEFKAEAEKLGYGSKIDGFTKGALHSLLRREA